MLDREPNIKGCSRTGGSERTDAVVAFKEFGDNRRVCAHRHTGSVYQSDYSDYYHYDDDNVYGVRVRGWCRSGNSIFRRIIRADFMV